VSAPKELFVTPGNPIEGAKQDHCWPKDVRLRKRSEFRRVYDQGFRTSNAYFAAVCLKVEGQAGAKVGFAATKALGGSVVRNRIRRRLREAVRLSLGGLAPGWAVVVQARKGALEAPFKDLRKEVEKLFARCGRS